MSIALSFRQPAVLDDAEHALDRRRFIKHVSSGVLGLEV
jgi:hypothetical protein